MAGIDKIYGSNSEWAELWEWLAFHRPQYIKFMLPPFRYEDEPRTISNFPGYADKWLYKHCPLKWVKARIRDQYNGTPARHRNRSNQQPAILARAVLLVLYRIQTVS